MLSPAIPRAQAGVSRGAGQRQKDEELSSASRLPRRAQPPGSRRPGNLGVPVKQKDPDGPAGAESNEVIRLSLGLAADLRMCGIGRTHR